MCDVDFALKQVQAVLCGALARLHEWRAAVHSILS